MQKTGSCLCGEIKITANNLSSKLWSCHCSMCRNWTGGPFMAVDAGSDVTFEWEQNISRFISSDWAERGFCKACGSNLFYYLKPKNQYMLLAGLFENIDELEFDHQIFIEEKPECYSFENKTMNMTGKEVFEQFA